MPIISLSQSDLAKGQPITPGWYKAEIISFVTKSPKSSNDSVNYVPTFKISDRYETELEHFFNSKAPGMMTPFIAAVEGKSQKEILDTPGGYVLDTDTYVGKKLQVEVFNDTFEGRLTNKIKGFLAIDAAVPF